MEKIGIPDNAVAEIMPYLGEFMGWFLGGGGMRIVFPQLLKLFRGNSCGIAVLINFNQVHDLIRKDNRKLDYHDERAMEELFMICMLKVGARYHVYRILKFFIETATDNDSDSEGLNGHYELSDSDSDSSRVTGDTGGTS